MAIFKDNAKGTLHYGKVQQKTSQVVASSHHHSVRQESSATHPPAPDMTKIMGGIAKAIAEKHGVGKRGSDGQRGDKPSPSGADASQQPEMIGHALTLAATIAKIVRVVKLVIFSFFAFCALIVLLINLAMSAKSATTMGTATARIVGDVFTSNCSMMSFGSIASRSGAGVVILTPQGRRVPVGLVSLGKAAYQPSTCDISGSPNTAYSIHVPRTVEFEVTPNEETPPPKPESPSWQSKLRKALQGKVGDADTHLRVTGINVFSENKRSYNMTGKTNTLGRDRLKVGATLHVSHHTMPGIYQGIIPVTVNY